MGGRFERSCTYVKMVNFSCNHQWLAVGQEIIKTKYNHWLIFFKFIFVKKMTPYQDLLYIDERDIASFD